MRDRWGNTWLKANGKNTRQEWGEEPAVLVPVSKQATKELRFILEGIKSGELEHNQDKWHCGTAHCVAGWDEVIDQEKFRIKELEGKRVTTRGLMSKLGKGVKLVCSIFKKAAKANEVKFSRCDSDGTAGAYSRNKWGLSEREGDFIFNGYATLAEQFHALKKFEAGYRII